MSPEGKNDFLAEKFTLLCYFIKNNVKIKQILRN